MSVYRLLWGYGIGISLSQYYTSREDAVEVALKWLDHIRGYDDKRTLIQDPPDASGSILIHMPHDPASSGDIWAWVSEVVPHTTARCWWED